MNDITIPPAALEAGVRAFAEAEENAYTTHAEDLRAAFLAIVEAWPGMVRYPLMDIDCTPPKIVLPLPQEITLNAQDISALDVKSTKEEISDE